MPSEAGLAGESGALLPLHASSPHTNHTSTGAGNRCYNCDYLYAYPIYLAFNANTYAYLLSKKHCRQQEKDKESFSNSVCFRCIRYDTNTNNVHVQLNIIMNISYSK